MIMKEEKISSYQLTMIIAGLFLGSAIALNPAFEYGSDAWFGSLVSIASGLVLAGISAALAMLHPGKALVGILIECFGNVAGKILGFMYMLLSMWLASVVVLNFSFYSETTNYPETPLIFISICYFLVIAFVVRKGLEVMGRISEVLNIVFYLVILVTFAAFFTDFNPDAFMPMFTNGVIDVTVKGMKGSLLPFAEIFLALNIFPNVNDKTKIPKAAFFSILIAGLAFIIFALRNVSVLGVDLAARNVYPSAKVFRLMPGLDVIPLLDINVIISGVLKVSFALYSQVKILADIFGLKEYKLLVLPFAALDVALSATLHHDIMTMLFSDSKIVPLVYIPILVFIPIAMLVISLIKKGRPELTGASSQAKTPPA